MLRQLMFFLTIVAFASTVSCTCKGEETADRPNFIDEYWADYKTDGEFVYTFYRMANATGYPMCIVFLEPGGDAPKLSTCQPGHALVYCVAGYEPMPLESTFGCIDVYFHAEEMYEGVNIYYNDFGGAGSSPTPEDPARWIEERTDDRHIYRTYIFTEADYEYARLNGTVY